MSWDTRFWDVRPKKGVLDSAYSDPLWMPTHWGNVTWWSARTKITSAKWGQRGALLININVLLLQSHAVHEILLGVDEIIFTNPCIARFLGGKLCYWCLFLNLFSFKTVFSTEMLEGPFPVSSVDTAQVFLGNLMVLLLRGPTLYKYCTNRSK